MENDDVEEEDEESGYAEEVDSEGNICLLVDDYEDDNHPHRDREDREDFHSDG